MGCFWGCDSLMGKFHNLLELLNYFILFCESKGATKGVLRTRVGYAGGVTRNPLYRSMWVTLNLKSSSWIHQNALHFNRNFRSLSNLTKTFLYSKLHILYSSSLLTHNMRSKLINKYIFLSETSNLKNLKKQIT